MHNTSRSRSFGQACLGVVCLLGWAACHAECSGPTYAALRPPKYPPAAVAAHVAGKVLVRVSVAANGNVSGVMLQNSSGNADLDAAAIEAVSSWRYTPRVCDGEAVAAEAWVPVEFNLDDTTSTAVPPDTGNAEAGAGDISRKRESRIEKDTLPMQFATVAEAMRFLNGDKSVQIGKVNSLDAATTWRHYFLPREREVFEVVESTDYGWSVSNGGAVSILRTRFVTNGSADTILYTQLCSGPAAWCGRILRFHEEVMQKDPPPIPPPAPVGPRE